MTIADQPVVHWKFRWNHNTAPPVDEIITFLNTYCSDWGFQLEKGESEDGLVHYQGHLRLVKKKRDPYKLFLATFKKEPNYLEPTANDTLKLIKSGIGEHYATKADTRIDGPWVHEPKPEIELYDCYDIGDKLTLFQKIWLDEIEQQTTREILCVYGAQGGIGKSTFGMWLLSTRPNIVIVPATMESAEDILQWVYAFVQPGKLNQATIILDIPRSVVGENSWFKFMTALEDIKRGFVYDKRYVAKFKLVYPPKIVVFSNKKPPEACLTPDRFCLMDIDEFVGQPFGAYDNQILVRKKPRKITPFAHSVSQTA